jgi:hypothetical protein
MSSMGLLGILLSLAGGLIAAAFVDSIEIVTASVVVLGVLYVFISKRVGIRSACKREGFSEPKDQAEITARVTGMEKRFKYEPTGVFDSSIEGFQDASASNDKPKEGAPSTSTAASAVNPNAGNGLAVNSANQLLSAVTSALNQATTSAAQQGGQQQQVGQPEQQPPQNTSGFADKPSGLFKLGELPSESPDGPHVDAASTLMKAMNSLKPDQITSMTNDTKQLLETQQSLMGMLKSMGPILQDGRKLLDSFSGIFNDGGAGGAMGAGGLKLPGM